MTRLGAVLPRCGSCGKWLLAHTRQQLVACDQVVAQPIRGQEHGGTRVVHLAGQPQGRDVVVHDERMRAAAHDCHTKELAHVGAREARD